MLRLLKGIDPDPNHTRTLLTNRSFVSSIKRNSICFSGQQYEAAADKAQSHYIQIQQGLNDKDPNKSAKVKDAYLKSFDGHQFIC